MLNKASLTTTDAYKAFMTPDVQVLLCLLGQVLIVIFKMLLIVFICTYLTHATGLAICPDHGVKSAFTGNRKTVFTPKRHDYCEYTHPNKDLRGSHVFWTDCQ